LTKVFTLPGKVYDLLYREKQSTDEVDFVTDIIYRHGREGKSLLELGCGTGRHMKVFQERGFNTWGIDQSHEMVETARKIGLNVRQGDIREHCYNMYFDNATALFHVVSYMQSNSDVLRFFQNANSQLADSGLLVFDAWYSSSVISTRPSTREVLAEDAEISVKRVAIPTMDEAKNLVHVDFDFSVRDKLSGAVSSYKERHTMRYFSIPEVEFFGDVCGFDLLEVSEICTDREPSSETWALCYVFKKR